MLSDGHEKWGKGSVVEGVGGIAVSDNREDFALVVLIARWHNRFLLAIASSERLMCHM